MHGAVVDLGAGTGANFEYFQPDASVVALEPDASMARRAKAKMTHTRADIELRIGDYRELEAFEAQSLDAVVMTLVLCTIPEPAEALRHAKRALKKNGALVLIEHVRSPGRVGRFQDFVAPAWRCAFGGCHLNRDTVSIVAAAGFDAAALRTKTLPKLSPIQAIVYGRASISNS